MKGEHWASVRLWACAQLRYLTGYEKLPHRCSGNKWLADWPLDPFSSHLFFSTQLVTRVLLGIVEVLEASLLVQGNQAICIRQELRDSPENGPVAPSVFQALGRVSMPLSGQSPVETYSGN